jgi:hypothetical protein
MVIVTVCDLSCDRGFVICACTITVSRDIRVAFFFPDFTFDRGGCTFHGRFLLGEREVLRLTRCLDALTSRQTQCTPDRQNENCLLSRAADIGHHVSGRLGRIMRDLNMRGTRAAPLYSPKGLAFEIVDLLLISSWADLNDCRTSIRLDHGADGEEYEEVIAFRKESSTHCQLIIWRNAMAVFVQPLIGRMRRYGSVAKALVSIDLNPRIVLTDIVATSWPTD